MKEMFCMSCNDVTSHCFVKTIWRCETCRHEWDDIEPFVHVVCGEHEMPEDIQKILVNLLSMRLLDENHRLRAFLGRIMVLGLLREHPRLRDEALKILDGEKGGEG